MDDLEQRMVTPCNTGLVGYILLERASSFPMLYLALSFLAGIAATVALICLYSLLRRSQLAELVVIALRTKRIPIPAQSSLESPQQEPSEGKERAKATSHSF